MNDNEFDSYFNLFWINIYKRFKIRLMKGSLNYKFRIVFLLLTFPFFLLLFPFFSSYS